MEQENHNSDEIKKIKTKAVFFIWILPILSLALLTGITVIGVHFLEQDSSISPSRLIRIATIAVIVTVLCVIVSFLHQYYCIRYMQIPVWRWIASGFKGEPALPWIKKPKKPEAKDKLNKGNKSLDS
jgi:hypothetical protein